MSASDEELYSQMLRVENKDVFVDLRKNENGIYLKLSERRGNQRKTVLIPASGIARLKQVLDEANTVVQANSASVPRGRGEGKSFAGPIGPVRSVYVNGLPWTTTDTELAAHFSQAGKVQSAVVLTQNRHGRVFSLGCGVVEYTNTRDAENAIRLFNNTELGGRTIVVREDRKTGDEKADGEAAKSAGAAPGGAPAADKVPVPNKVFIRNLAWATNDNSLLHAFGLAGRVIEAKVNLSRTGKSQGTGVVEYTDAASATKAILSLNGSDLDGRQITVREYYEN